jgi:predicted metalloendopeptidase
MPSESESSQGAGRRLLHTLIKYLFPDYDIKTNNSNYFIAIPRDISNMLSALSNKPRSYFDNAGEEGADALAKLNIVKQNIGGFVAPVMPNEIRISAISTDRNSKYNQLLATNAGTFRPRESFYSCAKACVEYQRMWMTNTPILLEFYRLEEGRQKEREAQAMVAKMERRRAERLRLEQEKLGKPLDTEKLNELKKEETKKLKKIEEEKEKEKVLKKETAQSAFNQAMNQFRRT